MQRIYNFKAQILIGIVAGLLQGVFMIGFYWMTEGEITSKTMKLGTFQGIAMAIIFGFVFPYISIWQRSKKIKKIDEEIKPLLKAEGIIHESPANLLRNLDPIEGKIFLTRKKLFFVPEDLSDNSSRRN